MLDGHTSLIAHLGYPTTTFKAPLIFNPFFESLGINAAVVPMGVRAQDFEPAFRAIFRFSNVRGALVTMPHKVAVVSILDRSSKAVRVAGSCNGVRVEPDGTLTGDMFDGEGFVRGVARKGRALAGASVLVVGAGGVGSAIAASLAARDVGRLALSDVDLSRAEALAARLKREYPLLAVVTAASDPAGHDIVVNATPLGMNRDDPLPFDVARLAPSTFVGEVVMKEAMTPLLVAARARGCAVQIGVDMLFEQIPAYLEFFGFPAATPEELRALARIAY
jgi:shikimate dehydrogenase